MRVAVLTLIFTLTILLVLWWISSLLGRPRRGLFLVLLDIISIWLA